MSERNDNREVFTNDVIEIAGWRNAPIGVDVKRFLADAHIVFVVRVITSHRYVIGDVVIERVPNGETFRSLEFFPIRTGYHLERYRPRTTDSSLNVAVLVVVTAKTLRITAW